jgi:ATP-dependent helicase/nuclease subunit A
MTSPLSPADIARANQAVAADPGLSVFVTANAGSGKTSTLVNRVARLLLKRVRPGDILCITYTKAAAAEMQTRLFDKLGGWAVADDRVLSESLAELDGRDPLSLTAEELSEARRLFARALETRPAWRRGSRCWRTRQPWLCRTGRGPTWRGRR